MDERVKTSFIPKTTIPATTMAGKKSPVALVSVVSGAIFILAVLASVGVFFFQQYVSQSIASKKESLQRNREAFAPDTIRELARLDARIETSKKLLASHAALSPLFDELEARTLTSLRFTSFSYGVGDAGKTILSMSGEAASYNAVAKQSEAFSKSSLITDPIFSGVALGGKGLIQFGFTAVLAPDHMLYSAGISAGDASPQATSSSSSATTSPTTP